MTAMLAHQGGWDEALLVVAPLLVLGGLLALAYIRGGAEEPERDDEPGET